MSVSDTYSDVSENVRVEFLGNGQVDILHVGLEALYPEIKHRYVSGETLPRGIADKISILAMATAPYPHDVPNVGTRLSQNVFWLTVEEVRDDTGKKGQAESSEDA